MSLWPDPAKLFVCVFSTEGYAFVLAVCSCMHLFPAQKNRHDAPSNHHGSAWILASLSDQLGYWTGASPHWPGKVDLVQEQGQMPNPSPSWAWFPLPLPDPLSPTRFKWGSQSPILYMTSQNPIIVIEAYSQVTVDRIVIISIIIFSIK